MNSVKTQAIIIKRMELGEADRLLTMFTYELGKVRAMAKGVRRPLSKLAGHLEPFTLSKCDLVEGKNFYTVIGADTLLPFRNIRDDLTKTAQAYYFLEMVDILVNDEQPLPVIFDLLVESLKRLEASQARQTNLLKSGFTFKLLAELGYLPELTRCVVCHASLPVNGNFFSSSHGGILGPECANKDYQKEPISVNVIKIMRLLASRPLGVIDNLKPSAVEELELAQIIESYLRYHTGRNLNSADFAKSMSKE